MNPSLSRTANYTVEFGNCPPIGCSLMVGLIFLFASNVFDPGGALGVKYVVFLLICILSLWTIKLVNLSAGEIAVGSFLLVVWPTWAFVYGAAKGGVNSFAFPQVTPFLFAIALALLLPAANARTPLRIYYATVFSLAIVVIVSFGFVFLLPDNPISVRVSELFLRLHESEGFFGTRSSSEGDVPIVYFRSSLFLVPAWVYFLWVGKLARAGITFLAIALAWSKAGLLIALAFGFMFALISLLDRRVERISSGGRKSVLKLLSNVFPILLPVAIATTVLAIFPGFYEFIVQSLMGDAETTLVRTGHFQSMMSLFADHPSYLLWGEGVGLPFYSLGESNFVYGTELAHLDAIRIFGLPWFLGFSAWVAYSVWRLIRIDDQEMKAFGFALASMYLAAGSNPVLISPLFLMLVMLCYSAQRTYSRKASLYSMLSGPGLPPMDLRNDDRVPI